MQAFTSIVVLRSSISNQRGDDKNSLLSSMVFLFSLWINYEL